MTRFPTRGADASHFLRYHLAPFLPTRVRGHFHARAAGRGRARGKWNAGVGLDLMKTAIQMVFPHEKKPIG